MSEGKYTKLMGDVEAPPPSTTLPEYAESDPNYTSETGDGPAKTHVFKSILATLCCCFPAGLAGLYFSMRAHCANKAGKYREAYKHSSWARKFVIVSFVFGTLALVGSTAFYVGYAVREVCAFNHAFKDGLNTGMTNGAVAGEIYAKELLSNNKGGASVKLPMPVPNSVNMFDVRKDNPFYVEVIKAIESHRPADAAKPFGEQFGWAHGFKVGFCGVEGTDCEGVVFVNSSCPYKAVFGGLGPWRRYHHDHHEREEEEEEHE